MYGLTGYETYAEETDTMWFYSMEELIEALAEFNVESLSELTQLTPNLWTL